MATIQPDRRGNAGRKPTPARRPEGPSTPAQPEPEHERADPAAGRADTAARPPVAPSDGEGGDFGRGGGQSVEHGRHGGQGEAPHAHGEGSSTSPGQSGTAAGRATAPTPSR